MIGRKGGQTSRGGGFAVMTPEERAEWGRVGGSRGKRGKATHPLPTSTHQNPLTDNEEPQAVNNGWFVKGTKPPAKTYQNRVRDAHGRFIKAAPIEPSFEVNIQELERALSLCSGDHKYLIQRHYNRGRDIANMHLYVLVAAAVFSAFFAFWDGRSL